MRRYNSGISSEQIIFYGSGQEHRAHLQCQRIPLLVHREEGPPQNRTTPRKKTRNRRPAPHLQLQNHPPPPRRRQRLPPRRTTPPRKVQRPNRPLDRSRRNPPHGRSQTQPDRNGALPAHNGRQPRQRQRLRAKASRVRPPCRVLRTGAGAVRADEGEGHEGSCGLRTVGGAVPVSVRQLSGAAGRTADGGGGGEPAGLPEAGEEGLRGPRGRPEGKLEAVVPKNDGVQRPPAVRAQRTAGGAAAAEQEVREGEPLLLADGDDAHDAETGLPAAEPNRSRLQRQDHGEARSHVGDPLRQRSQILPLIVPASTPYPPAIYYKSMQDPNFVVELFIRTLEVKHKLVFEKDKEEYFKVLFDTYLKGQGNPDELREYIAAGVENTDTISVIANEILEWQNKAAELKAVELTKKEEKEREKEKINDFVAQRTKKLKEEKEQDRREKAERPERKDRPERTERPERDEHRKPRSKPAPADPPAEPKQKEAKEKESKQGKEGKENNGEQEAVEAVEGQDEAAAAALKKGLKHELQEKGKEKCRFYPYCKNLDTCEFFHPSERCTYFPNCRYGDACLYEHEACRFKEKCTRPNCAYSHPFRKSNPIEEMMKTFMSKNNPLSRGGGHKRRPYRPRVEQREEPQGEQ